jgi:hypothetical protein
MPFESIKRQMVAVQESSEGKTMIAVRESEREMAQMFQRYTRTTTHDGTRTGRPWNKIKVQEPVGDGRYRIVVVMIAGRVLPEPYETIDTLAHALRH